MAVLSGIKEITIITICIMLISFGLSGCLEDVDKDNNKEEKDQIVNTIIFPELGTGLDYYNVTLGPIVYKDGSRITNCDITFIFNDTIEFKTRTNELGSFWFNVSKKIIEEFEGEKILWQLSGFEEVFYLVIEIGDTDHVMANPKPIKLE